MQEHGELRLSLIVATTGVMVVFALFYFFFLFSRGCVVFEFVSSLPVGFLLVSLTD